MATQTRLPVIDADAHVIETERTWDYLEPSERQFRPLLYAAPQDPTRQYWVIEDKIRGFRFPTLTEQQLRDLSQRSGRNVETPQAARELDDVQLRLQHMDALGIDIQVLHNTLWIEQVTQRPDVEAACAGAGIAGWPRCGNKARAACAGRVSCPPCSWTRPSSKCGLQRSTAPWRSACAL